MEAHLRTVSTFSERYKRCPAKSVTVSARQRFSGWKRSGHSFSSAFMWLTSLIRTSSLRWLDYASRLSTGLLVVRQLCVLTSGPFRLSARSRDSGSRSKGTEFESGPHRNAEWMIDWTALNQSKGDVQDSVCPPISFHLVALPYRESHSGRM